MLESCYCEPVGGDMLFSAETLRQQPLEEFALKLKCGPDAHPEAGHYYRSDHFSMARVGVPSFSVGEGLKFKGHDEAWGEAQAKDYVDHHYHQPSDEFQSDWNFAGLAEMARFGGNRRCRDRGATSFPVDVLRPARAEYLRPEAHRDAAHRADQERRLFR